MSVGLSDSFLQIQVGNGDSIEFETTPSFPLGFGPPPTAPNPALQLSSFESPNDTLTIDLANFTINNFFFDLGDQNDMLTVSGANSSIDINVNGGQGDDVLDASAFSGQEFTSTLMLSGN